MFEIDLKKLATCSKTVVNGTFGKISERAAKVYADWLNSQIGPSDALLDGLKAIWKTQVLMSEGVGTFAKKCGEFVGKHKKRAIFPVINCDWKSDAWLTGRALEFAGDLNDDGIGYGLTATAFGAAKTIVPPTSDYDLLIVDDASYSGTQLFNLMNSIWKSGLRPQQIFIMLSGISKAAGSKLQGCQLLKSGKCTPVSDPGITKMMNPLILPAAAKKLLQKFYSSHIEADPQTLKPKPTSGEFTPFMDVNLAILPYKIPDSVSVPTHVYLAYDPKLRVSIFESEGGHLFKGKGSVNYRTVMSAGKDIYAKAM